MMKSIYISVHPLILIILIYQFVDLSTGENVKKSIDDNREDNGENDEIKEESLDIAVESDTSNLTCTRRQNSILHEIKPALPKQFPFVAAIMSQQNEFLCSGSVVSNGLILTTAQCSQLPISYILLNTTKGKKDNTAVMLQVSKTEKFPTYVGGDSLKNVGLIYTEKYNSSVASKIRLSNYTSIRNIVDIEGIGFGLNAEVGQLRELQYIGMEHRPFSSDPGDIMKAYFDCVDTKVLTCYRDTGGPVIFDDELVGIVINGQDDCSQEISSIYAVNKKMADILPTYTFKAWIDERIKKNEEQEQTSLVIYPLKPVIRERVHKMSSGYEVRVVNVSFFILPVILVLF